MKKLQLKYVLLYILGIDGRGGARARCVLVKIIETLRMSSLIDGTGPR